MFQPSIRKKETVQNFHHLLLHVMNKFFQLLIKKKTKTFEFTKISRQPQMEGLGEGHGM
jgi:hypothetical protein